MLPSCHIRLAHPSIPSELCPPPTHPSVSDYSRIPSLSLPGWHSWHCFVSPWVCSVRCLLVCSSMCIICVCNHQRAGRNWLCSLLHPQGVKKDVTWSRGSVSLCKMIGTSWEKEFQAEPLVAQAEKAEQADLVSWAQPQCCFGQVACPAW